MSLPSHSGLYRIALYIYINYVIEHTCNIQICFSGSHSLLSHRGLQRVAPLLHAADEVVHGTADSLCDVALDADLGHLQRCFSDVPWALVTACKLITSITVCSITK